MNRGLTSHGPIQLRDGQLVFVPSGEPEIAYVVQATSQGSLKVSSTHPELPVTLTIDGHIALTGDLSVQGKATIAGSVDPTDLQLTPQPRAPIPAGQFGLWVADGSMPGTEKGGLYYDRAGERIRLDK